MTQEATPHHRSLWALAWLNVLVADVKTGVGPYLAVYLQASRHWEPVAIVVPFLPWPALPPSLPSGLG